MGIPLIARKGEEEESALKRWLSYAFIIVTICLLLLNVSGAWLGSHGNLFYTGAIAGAELFVALALGALMFTRNWLRFGVGIAIFLVSVWITLENGKMAVTRSFDDIFTGTPAELVEKAALAEQQAGELDTGAVEAKKSDKDSLAALREEMAGLKVEQQEMLAQSPAGIIKAQTRLKSLGIYNGPIDGLREQLTEGAMELRGEQIASRIAVVQAQIDALTGVGAPPVVPAAVPPAAPTPPVADVDPCIAQATTPAAVKRCEAIEYRRQAKEVEERTVWMNILLIGLEGIRSLALWVFLMDGQISVSRLRKRAQDQLALAKVNKEIAAVNAEIAMLNGVTPATVTAAPELPPAPEPVVAEAPETPPATPIESVEEVSTPEPAPTPPPEPELTDAQRWGREGAKQAQLNKKAEEARKSRVLIVGPVSVLDAMKVAAE